MSSRTLSLITALAVSTILAASPADARRTVIDEGEFLVATTAVTECTIGVECTTPVTMPFSFDFGSGATDQAYIYDSGIVSFGTQIPTDVDAEGSILDFGVPLIAPLYTPLPTGTAGPYEATYDFLSPDTFPTTLDNFGINDLFLVSFLDPSTVDLDNNMAGYVSLVLDASSDELRFELLHGQSNFQGEVITDPNGEGTVLGFSLLGQTLVDTSPDIGPDDVNAFTVTRGGGTVPEPATWLMMLLGFGGIGFAMRSAKRQLQTA